jgi:predicted MPP superfamily phosphohydrolase
MKYGAPILFGLVLWALNAGVHGVGLLGWADRIFPPSRRGRIGRRIAVGALALVPVVLRHVVRRVHHPALDAALSVVMLEVMFALIVAFPLLALRVIAWAGVRRSRRESADLAALVAPEPEPAPSSEELVPRRRAIELLGGAAVLGTTATVLGWGAIRGRYDYEVTEVPVRIPGLPRALDGYSIVQISDLHAGLFVTDRDLRDGTDRIHAIKPDLVVVTGDMVDADARHAPSIGRALASLSPRDGVVTILGNHDYYAGARQVASVVRATGASVLTNEGKVIRAADGGGFALLGTDDPWGRRYGGPGPDLARALSTVPEGLPRILLAHQPRHFDDFAGRVALQLSGHTHGGQIKPAGFFLKYVEGRYESAGSTLYVNRGFGVVGPPARIGARPEITKLVLVAA